MKKRILKGIKDGSKELLVFGKKMLSTALYFIVGGLYLIDWIFDAFYSMVAHFYKKINRRLQKVLFYLMIGLAIFGVYREFREPLIAETIVDKVEAKEVVEVPKNTKKEVVEIEVKKEEVKKVCELDEISCKIKATAERYGIDYKIAIAIARAEAGRDYTSNVARTKNNIGGIMYWDATQNKSVPRTFETLDAGIEYFVANLKNLYFDMGLDTLEEIQPKYCPIGAANDPNNLNSNWLRNTKAYYNELVKLEAK